MSRPIATGALVDIKPLQKTGRPNSEGGRGLVLKKKRRKINEDGAEVILTQRSTLSTGGESIFDVRYLVGGNLSQNVTRERIDVAMIGTLARRTPGSSRSLRPSLISAHHQPTTSTLLATASTPRFRQYSMLWLLSLVGKVTKRVDGTISVHLLEALKRKKRNDLKGWLRKME